MDSIVKNLKAPGALRRFRGILQCVDKKDLSADEKEALMAMRSGDEVLVGGRTISQFATAALDFLQILPYTGKDETVLELIPDMGILAENCLSVQFKR